MKVNTMKNNKKRTTKPTPKEREEKCIKSIQDALISNDCELKVDIIIANSWREKIALWISKDVMRINGRITAK